MPARSLIEWEGLRVGWGDDGAISLIDPRVSGEPFARLGVRFGPGWTRGQVTADDDEVEATWSGHGAVGLSRFRAVAALRMTVELRSATGDITVTPPTLEVESRWPSQTWLGEARGYVLLDPGRTDGRLLALVQERGESRSSSGLRHLLPIPTVLNGEAAPMVAVWSLRWIDHARELVGVLPPWWPDRRAFDRGDELVIDLPDAAIEAAAVHLLPRGESAVALTAHDGMHLVRVHESRGTTAMLVWWSPRLRDALEQRARGVLASDPRTCTSARAWLVNRELDFAERRESRADAVSWLTQACEELLAARAASPLLVALLADHAMRLEDAALMDAAQSVWGMLGTGFGRHMAGLHLVAACRAFDRRPPNRLPVPVDVTPGTLLAAAEDQVLATPDVEQPEVVWRALGVLGRGLPGDTGDELARAQALALASFVSERWDVGRCWAASLPEVTGHQLRRLLAESCSDEAFAWLLW